MAKDFVAELKKQMNFIHRSSLLYDQGFQDESIRIAVNIRVLFHQTAKSTSLLTHLGNPPIKLASTAQKSKPTRPGAIFLFDFCTTQLGNDGSKRSLPKLAPEHINEALAVDEWWNQVIHSWSGHPITRKTLVLGAANQDGGAHVDVDLQENYASSRDDGWRFGKRDDPTFVGDYVHDHHLVCIRQIAFELLNSPELIALMS